MGGVRGTGGGGDVREGVAWGESEVRQFRLGSVVQRRWQSVKMVGCG